MPKSTSKCPVCKAGADEHFRPFCSKRCADIDLGRWLTGSYVVAGGGGDEEDDSAEAPAQTRENAPPEE